VFYLPELSNKSSLTIKPTTLFVMVLENPLSKFRRRGSVAVLPDIMHNFLSVAGKVSKKLFLMNTAKTQCVMGFNICLF
jgi:hypothetical protein